MKDFVITRWHSRPGQNKLPIIIPLIHFISHGIPELRCYLPFIYQSWRFTSKQQFDIGIGHGYVLLHGIWIRYHTYPQALEQFTVSDERTAKVINARLKELGREPVWKDWDASFDFFGNIANG